MKTDALFIVLGVIGILVLIILAYGLEISHLIFDFKWKKKIKSFRKRSQKFFQSLVRTKMKRVKGKIIRLKQKIDFSFYNPPPEPELPNEPTPPGEPEELQLQLPPSEFPPLLPFPSE